MHEDIKLCMDSNTGSLVNLKLLGKKIREDG